MLKKSQPPFYPGESIHTEILFGKWKLRCRKWKWLWIKWKFCRLLMLKRLHPPIYLEEAILPYKIIFRQWKLPWRKWKWFWKKWKCWSCIRNCNNIFVREIESNSQERESESSFNESDIQFYLMSKDWRCYSLIPPLPSSEYLMHFSLHIDIFTLMIKLYNLRGT